MPAHGSVEHKLHRAMVTAHDVGKDVGLAHPGKQAGGGEEVVDTPPGVLLAGMETV